MISAECLPRVSLGIRRGERPVLLPRLPQGAARSQLPEPTRCDQHEGTFTILLGCGTPKWLHQLQMALRVPDDGLLFLHLHRIVPEALHGVLEKRMTKSLSRIILEISQVSIADKEIINTSSFLSASMPKS